MTAPTLDRLTQAIDSLYQAAYAPEAWPAALEQLANLLQSHSVGYLAQDLEGHAVSAVCVGNDPAFHAIYPHYAADNAYVRAFPRIADGTAFTESALLPQAEYRRTRFYNEWLAPQDWHTTLCGKIRTFGSTVHALAFCRGDRQPGYDRDELKLMDLLFPALRRVTEIQRTLGDQALQLWMSRQALDALSLGVLAVDAECRILFANEAAEQLLQDPRSGLSALRRVLALDRPAQTQQLRDLVAAACAGDGALRGAGGTLAWWTAGARDSQEAQTRLVLSVSPLDQPARFGLLSAPGALGALLFVKPTSLTLAAGQASQVGRLFGLTPAESRLAAALAGGLSLRETAARQGVGITTVRTHLARIFHKTGTQRQAELVALLRSTALPSLGGASPGAKRGH